MYKYILYICTQGRCLQRLLCIQKAVVSQHITDTCSTTKHMEELPSDINIQPNIQHIVKLNCTDIAEYHYVCYTLV